jgi:A/G-specific adenine glycosylase
MRVLKKFARGKQRKAVFSLRFLKNDEKMIKEQRFQTQLLAWFAQNHRPLPWKGERNPYFIWLSEIILQQTTVAQGLPYFERFCERYPTVSDLAAAPDDDVMKLWEGLGYYSRARNLLATARHIAFELNGVFPTTYADILTLKGVGPYTAAAIASFGFGEAKAVVDGNVYRVLSRVFGIETPIDSTEGKHIFNKLASEVLDEKRPADFNQAIMDFGATHCTPSRPKCGVACPMSEFCTALAEKKVDTLPIKSKKLTKRERFFNYLILNDGDSVYIRKRVEKDIWQDLYEFPLVETVALTEDETAIFEAFNPSITNEFVVERKSAPMRQLLTHQRIIAVFWEIRVKNADILRGPYFLKIPKKEVVKYAFPKVIDNYLSSGELSLF